MDYKLYTNPALRVRLLFLFILTNYLISLFIARSYLSYGPGLNEPLAWIYTRLAFFSHFAMLIGGPAIFLWPFSRFIRSSVQFWILPPTVMFLYQVGLLLDVMIYDLFRFHINGLVINTLTTEGAGDSVKLGSATIITIVLVLSFLAIVEWGGMRIFMHWVSRHTTPLPRYGMRPAFIFLIFLALIVADKLFFAYANFNEMIQITRYHKLYPLYQPLYMDETIEKYLGLEKGGTLIPGSMKTTGLLRYPIEEPGPGPNLKRWNMVWIVIDSWRFDMMNAELTPNIEQFSRKGLVFENHYSGGNATRFGIFPLFYGIYGTYWHQFLAERRSPVFIDLLQKEKYQFKIISSTRLTYPEFRKTIFVNIPPDSIEDHLPGDTAQRDLSIADRFKSFLDNLQKEAPFFAFMFLDAPHAPYHYPKTFEKYHPTVDEVNYFRVKKTDEAVRKDHPLFNRYRNAVSFSDFATNKILNVLKERKLFDRTIVIITGDHGEEFFETGYYGHNTTFSPFQAQVPLILYVPGLRPGKVKQLTSHLDIVPTMLALMGIRTDSSLYSQGRSLLEDHEHPYVVVSGWDTFAMVDRMMTIVLSTESYNAGMTEVRVGHYEEVEDPRAILKKRTAQLIEAARNLRKFLR